MKSKSLFILTAWCGSALATFSIAQTGAGGSGASASGSATGSATGTATTSTGTSTASGAPTSSPAPGTVVPGSVMPSSGTTAVPTAPSATAGANTGLGSSATSAADSTVDLGATTLPSGAMRPGTAGTQPIGPEPFTRGSRVPGVGAQAPMGVGPQPDIGVGSQPGAGVGIGPESAPLGGLPPVVVPLAPPDLPAEMTPASPAPSTNHVWVPGHFTWDGRAWRMSSGRWVVAPTPGATWVNGTYDPATRTWTPGYWEVDSSSPRSRGRPQSADGGAAGR